METWHYGDQYVTSRIYSTWNLFVSCYNDIHHIPVEDSFTHALTSLMIYLLIQPNCAFWNADMEGTVWKEGWHVTDTQQILQDITEKEPALAYRGESRVRGTTPLENEWCE